MTKFSVHNSKVPRRFLFLKSYLKDSLKQTVRKEVRTHRKFFRNMMRNLCLRLSQPQPESFQSQPNVTLVQINLISP